MSQLRATAMYGSWLYCSKNIHCSAFARSKGSEGTYCGPVREIPEDRARLAERPAVLEDHGRHAEAGVEIAEHLLAVRLVDDGERTPLVLDAEEGEEEANLVAVARDRRVVEDDRHSLPFAPGIQSVPASGTFAIAAASTVSATRSSGSRLWTWDLPQARASVCASRVSTRR